MDGNTLATLAIYAPIPIIVTITIALVQVIKKMDTANKITRFYPLFSLVIGAGLAFILHYDLLIALITGLSASGTYDVGKYTLLNQGNSA